MSAHVNNEMRFGTKRLPARLTLEWFLSGMRSCVNDELALPSEVLIANDALKRHRHGVRPCMTRWAI